MNGISKNWLHMNYRSTFKPRVFAVLLGLLLSSFAVWPGYGVARAQTTATAAPQLTGPVNDFAGVLDSGVKRQMEAILAEFQERAGIEFAIAAVKNTGGLDISDYSRQAAREWGINSRQGKKGLLLIVSTDDQQAFTQVSKQIEREMPEGLLGEIHSRLQAAFRRGDYNEGLMKAVQTVVATFSEKLGLKIEGVDRRYAYGQLNRPDTPAPSPTLTTAEASRAEASTKIADASASAVSPPPTEVSVASAPVTSTVAAATEPTPSATATPTPVPASAQPTDSAPAAPASTPAPPASAADRTRPSSAALASASSGAALSPEDDADSETVETTLAYPPAERIEKLKTFIDAHPQSALKGRAIELIIAARAIVGDRKLQTGDTLGAMEQFRLAISETPSTASDEIFSEVIAKVAMDLFVHNQRAEAFELERLAEAKAADNPKRLLALAGFYLQIEYPAEAARLAELAIKLAPTMAAAHQGLGAALHIALRLDDAAAEYARALELDPASTVARHGLADLRRANGKADEALPLYRELLKTDAKDRSACAGYVLSLFELGRKSEAEAELAAALKDEPRNLALLTGVAYWYAAHNDGARALDFAQRAVALEPRYTWSHIALARALVANNRPLEAEIALRFARQYGRFPTLDYELASALASAGLYEDAARELTASFSLQDGQIEAQLAGHVQARAANFTDLLALERKASIFQPAAADTEANARMLKGLLAFTLAVYPAAGKERGTAAEMVAGAEEFAAGEDRMRAYRQFYAASRLLQQGVAWQKILELTEGAAGGVEAALDVPVATIAVMADSLGDIRAQALAAGVAPSIPEIQREILSKVIRGRIEDTAGWALFNQDQAAQSVIRLRRAISVLPEGTSWLRTALWHLGTALDAAGKQQEALNAYLRSYNSGEPDPIRRATIERVYLKVNGSLDGLDAKIGPQAPVAAASEPEPAAASAASPAANETAPRDRKPSDTGAPSSNPSPAASPAPAPVPEATPAAGQPAAASTPAPAAEPARSPSAIAAVAPAPEQPSSPARGGLTVQIGSYNESAKADERAARLREAGVEARVVRAEIPNRGTWYRVQTGQFQSAEEARRFGEDLRARKLVLDFIVTQVPPAP